MKYLLLALATLTLPSEAATTHWKGAGKVEFAGTSTLHEWAGKVGTEPFTTIIVTDEAGKPQTLKASVMVKVAGMNTAEEGRDKNLRKSMNAEGFPLITGTFDAPFAKIFDPAGKVPATLPFSLELLGRTHPVNAQISHWKQTDNDASFDVDFSLSLKDCGITVPTVLLFIKVGDTIKLHASVKLKRINE